MTRTPKNHASWIFFFKPQNTILSVLNIVCDRSFGLGLTSAVWVLSLKSSPTSFTRIKMGCTFNLSTMYHDLNLSPITKNNHHTFFCLREREREREREIFLFETERKRQRDREGERIVYIQHIENQENILLVSLSKNNLIHHLS